MTGLILAIDLKSMKLVGNMSQIWLHGMTCVSGSRIIKQLNVAQRELEKEREHWRKVLLRIILIVKFLAEHNIVFRGSNSRLYQDHNGNFLGLVQILAEFDPVIKEHVDHITNDKIRDHYLGPSI